MMLTRNRLALGTVAAVAALAPATASAAGLQHAAAGCNARGATTWTRTTTSYRLQLHVGMPEQMYTPAQVKKMHPKSGEVMMGGAMGMSSGMSMSGGSMRHLEVQICSKKTGAVIANAKPTITLVDESKGGMMTKVPVAMMQGIGHGMEDFHYGNNVTMPGGRKFTVKVTLNGETAVFRVQMPKGA